MVSRKEIKRDYLTALVDVSYMIGKEEHVLYNLDHITHSHEKLGQVSAEVNHNLNADDGEEYAWHMVDGGERMR